MIKLNIKDESSKLLSVVLGIADSFGGVPKLEDAYDPKSKEHIRKGTYPVEQDMVNELSSFEKALKKHDVQVFRPECVENVNQVFARDIGFVVEQKFVVSNILVNRSREIEGINYLLEQIDPSDIVRPPKEVRIEGGDVMPWKGKIFIGYSEKEDFDKYQVARTNREGIEFMKHSFPDYEVFPFQLNKSDTNPLENALHLDCCFQPIGNGQCIIYPGGFKEEKDYQTLVSMFGSENMIEISQEEMYEMNSNIFSISPEVIVSEVSFTRLNSKLRAFGYTVEEVPFSQIAKMEGLLRCTTLPLEREY